MLLTVKGNCENSWRMEGYAECIKSQENKSGKQELTFKLTTVHTPPGTNKHHYTPIKVVLKENQARIVSAFLKPMMLVKCEGHYELGENGKAVMACQRCWPSDNYMVEVDYKLSEEKSEVK